MMTSSDDTRDMLANKKLCRVEIQNDESPAAVLQSNIFIIFYTPNYSSPTIYTNGAAPFG